MEENKIPKVIGWTPSAEEVEIFDQLQRKFYRLNKSEILRRVFAIGAEALLKDDEDVRNI